MVDQQAPANHSTWMALLGGMSLADFSKGIGVVHAFWDSVALRRPGQYCMRTSYRDVMHAAGPGSHQRAVIIGKRTPTVEFRLFKAARSPQVVRSYLEVVAALIEFATDPPADLLHPATETTAREKEKQAAHVMMVEYLLADENVRANLIDDHGVDEENLESYIRGEVARGVSPRSGGGDVGLLVSLILNGYAYERAENHLRGLVWAHDMEETTYAKLFTLRKAIAYTVPPSIGAVSWKHGIFPVASFITFVTEREKVYPALAARFALPKFQRFVGGTYTVEEDDTPFDTDTPHDTIRVGCLCRDQLYYPGEARVCHIRRIKTPVLTAGDTEYDVRGIAGKPGTSPANEAYMGDTMTVSGDNILHICQGATRLEGHDE